MVQHLQGIGSLRNQLDCWHSKGMGLLQWYPSKIVIREKKLVNEWIEWKKFSPSCTFLRHETFIKLWWSSTWSITTCMICFCSSYDTLLQISLKASFCHDQMCNLWILTNYCRNSQTRLLCASSEEVCLEDHCCSITQLLSMYVCMYTWMYLWLYLTVLDVCCLAEFVWFSVCWVVSRICMCYLLSMWRF